MSPIRRLPVWGTLLGALVCAGCRGSDYRARLGTGDEVSFVRAIKGNDLVVSKGQELARVRLVGVYAFDPLVNEKGDITTWARGAASAVNSRFGGQPLRVTLIRQELDPRGRHLAYLTAGETDVGAWLIAEGHAAAYTEYPFARESDYLAAESEARAASRGVWGGLAAVKRLRALRETWAAVRTREYGAAGEADPLLRAGAGR